MTTRSTLAALSALCLAFACNVDAQPASAASASTSLTPTADTQCGAAGTGYEWRRRASDAKRVKNLVSRPDADARPGAWSSRVDAQGEWVGCRVPPKAPDCAAIEAPAWGALACSSGQTVKAGSLGATRQVHDTAFKGRLYLSCTPTGWVVDNRPGYTYCQH